MSIQSGHIENVRQMYCAAPGKKLIHADWRQIEPRLLSIIAPDKVLEEDIASGDLYSAQVRHTFGLKDTDIVKKEARDQQKKVHLGSQYSASTPTVHEQVLVNIPTMKYQATKLYHAKWKERYKGVVEYWHREYSFVLNHGYSESRILKRRLYYAEKPEITKTANYPIQSTAADINILCLIALDKALNVYNDKAKLITNFYDAFDIEVDDNLVEEISILITNIMEQPFELCERTIKFPVECKVGQLWSEAS